MLSLLWLRHPRSLTRCAHCSTHTLQLLPLTHCSICLLLCLEVNSVAPPGPASFLTYLIFFIYITPFYLAFSFVRKAIHITHSLETFVKKTARNNDDSTTQARDINGSKVVVARLEGVDGAALLKAAVSISEALGDPSAVVLASAPTGGGKVVLVTAFSESLVKEKKMNAGKFVGGLAKICGGGGGGKPALAQAGGKNAEKLPEALAEAEAKLQEALASC